MTVFYSQLGEVPIILAPELAHQFINRGHPDVLFADEEGVLSLKSMCTDQSRLKYYIATLYPTDLEIGFQGVVNSVRASVAAPEALAAIGGNWSKAAAAAASLFLIIIRFCFLN